MAEFVAPFDFCHGRGGCLVPDLRPLTGIGADAKTVNTGGSNRMGKKTGLRHVSAAGAGHVADGVGAGCNA